MIDLLMFLLFGLAIGVLFGLIPGLHPNLLVALIPLTMLAGMPQPHLIVFVTALAVANVITDFIPTILLGAPEEGTELAVTPGHRMVLAGHGYQAVKLAVLGGLGGLVTFMLLLLPIILLFPVLYSFIEPLLWIILTAILALLIWSEPGTKKIAALAAVILAGTLGLTLPRIPLDTTIILFPVLSGLFGASMLIAPGSNKKHGPVPRQKPDTYVSPRHMKRSVLGGALGGSLAGLLPGVGTSQIASAATLDKNEKSFLMTLGAIATVNIVMSIISLWLIGKTRSGAAVLLEAGGSLTSMHIILVLASALAAAGLAGGVALAIARRLLMVLNRVDYALVSRIILAVITIAVVVLAGIPGLLLFAVCIALGLFAHLSGIRMTSLMAVLIIPTIVFYLPW